MLGACSRSQNGTIRGRNLAWENLGKRSHRIRAETLEDSGKGLDRRRAQDKPSKKLGRRLVNLKESYPFSDPRKY